MLKYHMEQTTWYGMGPSCPQQSVGHRCSKSCIVNRWNLVRNAHAICSLDPSPLRLFDFFPLLKYFNYIFFVFLKRSSTDQTSGRQETGRESDCESDSPTPSLSLSSLGSHRKIKFFAIFSLKNIIFLNCFLPFHLSRGSTHRPREPNLTNP